MQPGVRPGSQQDRGVALTSGNLSSSASSVLAVVNVPSVPSEPSEPTALTADADRVMRRTPYASGSASNCRHSQCMHSVGRAARRLTLTAAHSMGRKGDRRH